MRVCHLPKRSGKAAALVCAIALASTPCVAITARDVMEKMSEKERFGYLSGLVDMLSYQSLLGGDRKRAECVYEAFYKEAATTKKLIEAFNRFPEKAPEGLVILLMRNACGG